MTLETEKPGSPEAHSKKNSKGILCVKCGYVSPSGTTRCERCNSHLHVKCNDCGATNARSQSRCKDCGRRLHKSLFEKAHRRMFKETSKITPLQIILLVLAVGAVFFVILFLANLRFPSLF